MNAPERDARPIVEVDVSLSAEQLEAFEREREAFFAEQRKRLRGDITAMFAVDFEVRR